MRARAETFGAWVRVDDRTLVALDRDAARRLGIDGGKRWREPAPASIEGATDRPLEVHVAVTARCPATCDGCYLDARADGAHRPFDELAATLDTIARRGAFTVAFGGGEPLTHPELPRLAEHARSVGLTPVVTTSGIGLTEARARALRAFAQVNVSYDGVGETYETVRGFAGAHVAERAIATLVAAEIAVGVNVVLTRQNFATLERLAKHVVSLGARELQLLRWKPAGRAASLDYLTRRLSRAQVRELPALVGALTAIASVRIDCALVPLLSFTDPDALLRLAVMGCEAGRALGAVDVRGDDAPCSFLRGVALPKYDVPEPCASCPVQSVCRSGCRVVSQHVLGDLLAPDPECPRVIEANG